MTHLTLVRSAAPAGDLVSQLMGLSHDDSVAVGEAMISVEYTAPGCPEGHFIISTDTSMDQAWFTSPVEHQDQAEALVAEFAGAL